jgi:hypothetical protein
MNTNIYLQTKTAKLLTVLKKHSKKNIRAKNLKDALTERSLCDAKETQKNCV